MSKNFREDKNNIEYDLYEPCKRKKFKKDNQLSIKNMKALGEELINFTEYSPKLKNLKARQK